MQVIREPFQWDIDYVPQIIGSQLVSLNIGPTAESRGCFMVTYRPQVCGTFMISDDCMDVIDGTRFGVQGRYKVTIIEGPRFFKVM